MKKYKCISRPSSSAGFCEASTQELRVLLAVIESNTPLSEEDILKAAGVSKARVRGALAFWEAEGVVSADGSELITEEFEERIRPGEILEESALEVAANIRNENLADLIDECALMIEKPALTDMEIKCVSALVTQYSLTEDYILELAAYIKSKGSLTVSKLRDKAISLVGKGVDNAESLGIYISEQEARHPIEMEFRRLLGIYERKLSDSERKMFIKWAEDFGYSAAVVSEAYNVTVMNTGKLSLTYMDKVLTGWHEAGCKTVEECIASKNIRASEEREKRAPEKRRQKSEPQKPRYGDFDVNDAFAKALERSYNPEEK